MAAMWGDVLASRHKRASYVLNEQGHEMPQAFSKLIDGKEDDFDELVESIAFQYADCVKQDYRYFLEASMNPYDAVFSIDQSGLKVTIS